MDITKQRAFSYSIIFFSVLALISAHSLEFLGILPCRLCMYQRIVYYIMVVLGTLMVLMQKKDSLDIFLKVIQYLTFFLFVIGIFIGIFQVLVEYNLVKYNSSCTASFSGVNSPEELFESINSKDLVACDKPQLFILGLSLAEWNCIYMIFMLSISLFVRYKEISFIKNFLEKNAEK